MTYLILKFKIIKKEIGISFRTSQEEYVQVFISILKRLNTQKTPRADYGCDDDRMNFHNFTDVCWNAVDFNSVSTVFHELEDVSY